MGIVNLNALFGKVRRLTGTSDTLQLPDYSNPAIPYNSGNFSASATFNFAGKDFIVPAGATKKLYVYANTIDFGNSNDFIATYLSDSSDDNLKFGLWNYFAGNYSGSYAEGKTIFRGGIFGGTLSRSVLLGSLPSDNQLASIAVAVARIVTEIQKLMSQ